VQAQTEADTAWEKVKGIDRGQGLGKRLDEIQAQLREAGALLERKAHVDAQKAFRAVGAACRSVQEADQQRRQAREARGQTEKARKLAEGAAAAAGAKALWAKAEAREREALRQYESADFAAARADWQAAGGAFEQAAKAAAGRRVADDARTAYEEDLLWVDQKRLAAEAGPAWQRVVAAAAAAQKADAAGRYDEAARHYRKAQELLPQANRMLRAPLIKAQALVAGYGFAVWAGFTHLAETTRNKVEAADYKDKVETQIRPLLRRYFVKLRLPQPFTDRVLGLKTINIDQIKDLHLEINDQIDKVWGQEIVSSFEVGFELAAAHVYLLNLRSDTSSKSSALRALERAKNAAYTAGHPQAVIDTLNKIGTQAKEGGREAGMKTVLDFISQMDDEAFATRLFRQPRAVAPDG
jgi:hypothetical protein